MIKVEPICSGKCDGDRMCTRLAMYRITFTNGTHDVCDMCFEKMINEAQRAAQAEIHPEKMEELWDELQIEQNNASELQSELNDANEEINDLRVELEKVKESQKEKSPTPAPDFSTLRAN